jgi:hypothetical protein
VKRRETSMVKKVLYTVALLIALGLVGCSPSASRVATAIAQTEAARPTQTAPQPTVAPACDVEGYWAVMEPLLQQWDEASQRLSTRPLDDIGRSDLREIDNILVEVQRVETPDCLRDTHAVAVEGMWCLWRAWAGLRDHPDDPAAYVMLLTTCSGLAEYRSAVHSLLSSAGVAPGTPTYIRQTTDAECQTAWFRIMTQPGGQPLGPNAMVYFILNSEWASGQIEYYLKVCLQEDWWPEGVVE